MPWPVIIFCVWALLIACAVIRKAAPPTRTDRMLTGLAGMRKRERVCQRCHLRLDLAHHMEKRKGAKQERLEL